MVWVHVDGEIHHRRRTGVTWTAAEVVTQTGGKTQAPALAADGLGRVHLVWQDRRQGDQIYYRCWNGVTWDAEECVSRVSSRPFTPHVAADSLGRLHVVWLGVSGYDREMWYSCRADTGWVAEVKLAVADPAPVPWEALVACEGGDRVHVIWEDHRQNDQWSIMATRLEDGEWSAAERVSAGPGKAFFPAVALDARGTLHVAWTDSRNGCHDIYYRRWSPAGWLLCEQATCDSSDAYQPCLAVDGQGIVHLAWSDNRDGNREIYAMRREPDDPWDVDPPVIPVPLSLDCCPNPFRLMGDIRAQLPSAGLWTLSFFDIQGRLVDQVRELISRPGLHEFDWDGRALDGRLLPRGVYCLRLAGNGRAAAGRIVLSRP